jgi:hypothetical protein
MYWESATMGGVLSANTWLNSLAMSLGIYRRYGAHTVPNWIAYKAAWNQRFANDEATITTLIRAAAATYLRRLKVSTTIQAFMG